ncbi:MAG: Gx transporter family protein [Clostridia bacterium]|nr:Gx transporter family protein [Clostridia bacterium]
MRNKKTKKLAFLGLCTAVTLILAYVEALLPPLWAAVPGIKMGLPNIMLLFLLYRFSVKEAAAVSLVRLFAVALLFGNIMTLAYSFAGAVLSLAVMNLLKRIDRFSMVAVSIMGGIFHNLGQVLVAILVLETAEIGYYMIVLTVTGTIAGILIGLAGYLVLKYLKQKEI